MALQQLIVSFGFVFIQRAVNSYGEAMTASFAVAQKVETYMILPASSLMTTQGTFTGQNIGAGRLDRVKLGVRQTMLISLVMTISIAVLVWTTADGIIRLFALSDEAAVYCLAHLRTIAFVNIVLSMYLPLFGVFQGANHSGVPTVVATGALGMRVLTTYLFRYSSFLGYRII